MLLINILGDNQQVECCTKGKHIRHLRKPTYKGQSKPMPPVFYFMLFPSWTWESFIELHCGIAEGIVIFQCILHLNQLSSSTFQQEHVLNVVKVAGCLLQGWLMVFCSALSLAYWCLWSSFLSLSLFFFPLRGCWVDAPTLSIKILWWPPGMRQVSLWTSCLGAQQKLWCYFETPRSWMLAFFEFIPLEICWSVAATLNNTRLLISAHATETITNLGLTVLPYPPYNPDLAP